MVAMAATTGSSFRLPHDGRPFTVHDLEATPDDGNRYELIDGVLLVSPAPSYMHQRVVFRLGIVLDAACPPGMEVLVAPFAVRPSETTELQPDVLVFREEDVTPSCQPVAPLLAVEVLSPSTKAVDLVLCNPVSLPGSGDPGGSSQGGGGAGTSVVPATTTTPRGAAWAPETGKTNRITQH